MKPSDTNKDAQQSLFVQTPFFQDIIKRSLQYLHSSFPIHFVGPTGVGKTSLALYIAKQLKRPITVIRGHHEMSNSDLLGRYLGVSKKELVENYIHSVYKKEQEIKPVWANGQLAEAVKNGHTLVFDEFTRSNPETNNIFLSVLEERVLPLYGNPKEPGIPVHPCFSVIFTSNPEEYAGVFKTQDALLDRLITIDLEYCDLETEVHIIRYNARVTLEEAKVVAKLVSRIRAFCMLEKKHGPSLRASIMIASIAKKTKIPIRLMDKRFQLLCLDVLWLPVYRCEQGMDKQTVKEYILHEIMKMGKDDGHG